MNVLNNKGEIHLNSQTVRLSVGDVTEEESLMICGPNERNLRVMSECFGVEISSRSGSFFVQNADEDTIEKIQSVLLSLISMIRKGKSIGEQDIIYMTRLAGRNEHADFESMSSMVIGRTLAGKAVVPKTMGQYHFAKAMNENTIVFAIGPAGTGKTYLAVIQAVSALKKGEVKRIVLTRPAVEAGENLGFLPGDLKEKVDPYLTPLYDALHVMLGNEKTEVLIEKGTIEIAPLAYMRGRTLDDSYVILDEAQNTTASQMKMFLTRLGFHSHMVITGDVTQIDLDRHAKSGLVQASDILKNIPDIEIVHLSSDDVVRHPLVQKIIERYEQDEEKHLKKV